MFLNQKDNEEKEKEDNKISNANNSVDNNNIFKKVQLQIKLNKYPEIKSESKGKEKEKEIKLPRIKINQIIKGRKMTHVQNFCNSIYSIYSNLKYNNNNQTINNIKNIREGLDDILKDSKLKAIEDIKHYFFINKFPNEVNFRKNAINDLYKKIYTTRARVKPLSLNKIKNNKINDEEKFTLITTLNVKKEKKEKKENKIYDSVDSYSNRNRRINFADYADNNIKMKHPVLYQLNNLKNKNNKLPGIRRRNKLYNDIVEISELIPDKTEINKENKIINYDEYMRLKELKMMK